MAMWALIGLMSMTVPSTAPTDSNAPERTPDTAPAFCRVAVGLPLPNPPPTPPAKNRTAAILTFKSCPTPLRPVAAPIGLPRRPPLTTLPTFAPWVARALKVIGGGIGGAAFSEYFTNSTAAYASPNLNCPNGRQVEVHPPHLAAPDHPPLIQASDRPSALRRVSVVGVPARCP